jgi:peptidoglycan biosynthesis protein MviN/MurJ (putative lipid II flippase)
MFVLTMYGKQLGKFKLTKLTSAITTKIVSLLFPFGTWTLTLLFYYCVTRGKKHPVGDKWNLYWSFLRLLGFIIIVVSVWFFKPAAQVRMLTMRTFRGTCGTKREATVTLLCDTDTESFVVN